MSDSKKKPPPIGMLELHLYGGLLSIAVGAASWYAGWRPLSAFLTVFGFGLFYLGRFFAFRKG